MADTPKLLIDTKDVVGECPTWLPEERALYWTDIGGKKLHRLEVATNKLNSWDLPQQLGSFAFRENGGVVCAFEEGFAFYDLTSGRLDWIADPEGGNRENRLNDGRAAPDGAFWAGTMNYKREKKGYLYRLGTDLKAELRAGPVAVSNGMGFSPDGKTMYHSDSSNKTIWAYDHDMATGATANQRVFANTTDEQGRPDGAAVDAEGYYWSACNRGGNVIRFAPDGSVDRTIPFPVKTVTMPCFGGDDLQTLYVTTLTEGFTPEMKKADPGAGALFSMRVDVPGQVEPKFKA